MGRQQGLDTGGAALAELLIALGIAFSAGMALDAEAGLGIVDLQENGGHFGYVGLGNVIQELVGIDDKKKEQRYKGALLDGAVGALEDLDFQAFVRTALMGTLHHRRAAFHGIAGGLLLQALAGQRFVHTEGLPRAYAQPRKKSHASR